MIDPKMPIQADVLQSSRVGAVLLIRKDGAVLMQHRDVKPGIRRPGMWVPPGGHAETNEDMQSCAKREFLEETAYNCSNLKFLAEFEDHVLGWPPYTLTVYWESYDGKQLFKCLEGQNLKFINREQVDSYDIPKNILKVWDLALAVSMKNCTTQLP
jgi:8-oxo-dGTP pyrophosphatase MutT (NUDIX family)